MSNQDNAFTCIEYIWLHGQDPALLRSKTKVIKGQCTELTDIPIWDTSDPPFGGDARNFAEYFLKPVFFVPDPLRGAPHLITICELFTKDELPHSDNTRALLRLAATRYEIHNPWFGIEQEYTLMRDGWPLGFLKNGFPFPHRPAYNGVGADRVSGRDLVEEHMMACLAAGLNIGGINAEAMPGQWEFQLGPLSPLDVSDQLWVARWLLHRLGEKYEYDVSFEPKLIQGQWHGSGAHTNFSTKEMRSPGGIKAIKDACEKLRETHVEHLAVYGANNHQRLARQRSNPVDEFNSGVANRKTSVRIPLIVAAAGAGYLEDRRPGANMDPYLVTLRLLQTLCDWIA